MKYLLKNDKNALTMLKGDGDFRSEECLELLDECDIVVTNPPFSLMKEYIPLIMESGKSFLILARLSVPCPLGIYHLANVALDVSAIRESAVDLIT